MASGFVRVSNKDMSGYSSSELQLRVGIQDHGDSGGIYGDGKEERRMLCQA